MMPAAAPKRWPELSRIGSREMKSSYLPPTSVHQADGRYIAPEDLREVAGDLRRVRPRVAGLRQQLPGSVETHGGHGPWSAATPVSPGAPPEVFDDC